jgi:hypothetical protein
MKLNRLTQLQTTTPKQKQDFYPTVINNTDIKFSEREMTLLQKGPKNNLHSKKDNSIQNLALEAKTAISQPPPSDRDAYRKLTAEHITTLLLNNTSHTKQNTHLETTAIRAMQTKLKNNEAMTANANKGNSLVILPIKYYNAKVQNFIQVNSFHTATRTQPRTFNPKSERL